jgi:hypothetical protein
MEAELAVVWYAESLCDKFCMVIKKWDKTLYDCLSQT